MRNLGLNVRGLTEDKDLPLGKIRKRWGGERQNGKHTHTHTHQKSPAKGPKKEQPS